MPDYKEMYLIMARAAEKAQRFLIAAQRQGEELYLSADDAEKARQLAQLLYCVQKPWLNADY